MSTPRTLSIALVVLVLLNVATLGVLMFRKPPHHGAENKGGPKAMVIERLQLDADQVRAYEQLIADHRQRIDELSGRMTELRSNLYVQQGALTSDSLLHAIGETQIAIERTHTDHFVRIRALCRPEQLQRFEALTNDLGNFFRPGPPGKAR